MNISRKLSRSEHEVLEAIRNQSSLKGKKVTIGRGSRKIAYTKTYVRHSVAIDQLKADGIIYKNDDNVLTIYPQYRIVP